MFKFRFKKDGYLKVSDLQQILDPISEMLGSEFSERDEKINALKEKVRRLESELEAERRLRLSMKAR